VIPFLAIAAPCVNIFFDGFQRIAYRRFGRLLIYGVDVVHGAAPLLLGSEPPPDLPVSGGR